MDLHTDRIELRGFEISQEADLTQSKYIPDNVFFVLFEFGEQTQSEGSPLCIVLLMPDGKIWMSAQGAGEESVYLESGHKVL
jgi:hypothetical protein